MMRSASFIGVSCRPHSSSNSFLAFAQKAYTLILDNIDKAVGNNGQMRIS